MNEHSQHGPHTRFLELPDGLRCLPTNLLILVAQLRQKIGQDRGSSNPAAGADTTTTCRPDTSGVYSGAEPGRGWVCTTTTDPDAAPAYVAP